MFVGLLGMVMGFVGLIGIFVILICNVVWVIELGEFVDVFVSIMSVMQGVFGVSLWGILLSLGIGVVFVLVVCVQEIFEDEFNVFVYVEFVLVIFFCVIIL